MEERSGGDAMDEQEWVTRCVMDMGWDEKQAKEMLAYAHKGEWMYALCLARQQKRYLLSCLHHLQSQIDCLDDLIYQMTKQAGKQ